MLRSILIFVLVLVPVTAHAQLGEIELPDPPIQLPDPPSYDTDPDPPVQVAPAAHGALIGQFVGFGVGAFMGGLFWAHVGTCDPDADCTMDIVLAASVAAAFVGPLGAAAGAVAGGELAGLTGEAWAPFWITIVDLLLAAVAVPIWMTEGELTAAALMVFLQPLIHPLLMGAVFEGRDLSVRPHVAPIPEGFTVGVSGSF